MENKRKHLELIQGVIERMASNLFYLKGWAITLIIALFALGAKDASLRYIGITFLPVIIFWVLDGYFLSHERQFRDLYDHVRTLDEKSIDFSMDTRKYKTKTRNKWLRSMFSPTLLWFYVSLIVIMGITAYVISH